MRTLILFYLLHISLAVFSCKKDKMKLPNTEAMNDSLLNNNLSTPVDSISALEIIITNFPNQNGNVNMALFNNENDFDNKTNPFNAIISTLTNDTVYLNIDSLPAGDYAFSVYHDENANSQLDQNIFGIPTEYFGFSNNAMGTFGPPTFSQAKFTSNGKDDLKQEIILNHF